MDTTKENVLYDSAVTSSVQKHLSMLDFTKMQADVLADARSTATDFGVDENHAVKFVTQKLGETFISIRAEIAERAANEVELARNQARVIRQDYFDKIEALFDGVEAEFDRVRSESITSEPDLTKFPELVQYAEHMKRIGDEGAERMISVAALATNQFASLLRLKFRNELKLLFSQAFIGENEIAPLIDFYAETLPEVNLAA